MALRHYDTGLKKIYYKDVSEFPATDGEVRLGHDGEILWRNEANTANIGFSLNSSDELLFDGQAVSGTPGGSNTQVQFNDSGAFGGDTTLTFDKVNEILALTGKLDLYSISAPPNPDVNSMRLYTIINGNDIELWCLAPLGGTCLLCSQPNTAPIGAGEMMGLLCLTYP